MSMDALVAKFRAQQPSACRICKGTTKDAHPYCLRHFFMLKNMPKLTKAASEGLRLDEIDAFIMLRERFKKGALWIDNEIRIGAFLALRPSAHQTWVLYRATASSEQEVGRFPSLIDACKEVLAYREATSAHNKWATKTLIR